MDHVPIIDVNPRRDQILKDALKREARALDTCGFVRPEAIRYRIRSGVERTYARLKDEFGTPASVRCFTDLSDGDKKRAKSAGSGDREGVSFRRVLMPCPSIDQLGICAKGSVIRIADRGKECETVCPSLFS